MRGIMAYFKNIEFPARDPAEKSAEKKEGETEFTEGRGLYVYTSEDSIRVGVPVRVVKAKECSPSASRPGLAVFP
jgi:hypothetical protein